MARKRDRLPWNWRSRIEVVEEQISSGKIAFELVWVEGTRPRGWEETLGELWVEGSGDHLVDLSHLVPQMRGRRLGRLMYEHALLRMGSLSTGYWRDTSDKAQRVWMSLIRDYEYATDFFTPRLTVYDRPRVRRKGKSAAKR